MNKNFAILSLLLALAVSLTGCNVFDGTAVLDKTATPVITTPVPDITPKSIDETFETDNFTVKLSGYQFGRTVSGDDGTTVAETGKVFLVVYLDVMNRTDSTQYFTYQDLRGSYDGETATQYLTRVGNMIDNRTYAEGDISAGETALYFAMFSVDENWSVFRLEYDIGTFSEPDIQAIFEFDR